MGSTTEYMREYMRKWRIKNQVLDIYLHLKSNAKRRGIRFTISFKDFDAWLPRIYLEKRGRCDADLTIDRIKPKLGYRKGNLQLLKNQDNRFKFWEADRHGIGHWKPLEEVEYF